MKQNRKKWEQKKMQMQSEKLKSKVRSIFKKRKQALMTVNNGVPLNQDLISNFSSLILCMEPWKFVPSLDLSSTSQQNTPPNARPLENESYQIRLILLQNLILDGTPNREEANCFLGRNIHKLVSWWNQSKSKEL
ncbi:hypothetical protein PVL29_004864 [Vitis rotundifolia]|uniref:Uncharacterized protein n=1 Tax=Vitis rotundifolia TaxID=103349 RepID=A0AA39ABC2_VITRO|nr:hypothetical protein PVL29_004864 [Vitis rotundifolia]